MRAQPPRSTRTDTLFPYTTLFRSRATGAAHRSAVAPASVAAWRDGRLFVDGATVAEVVDRIRPYQSGWIVIAGSGLGGRKVTGLYDLHDPDNALRALVEAHGGEVRAVHPDRKSAVEGKR